jgi:hypothetical protein
MTQTCFSGGLFDALTIELQGLIRTTTFEIDGRNVFDGYLSLGLFIEIFVYLLRRLFPLAEEF